MARGKLKIGDGRTILNNQLASRHLRFAKMVAQLKMDGLPLDYAMLGRVFNRQEKIPEAKAKILMRQRVMQELITEEILVLMSQKGITKESVIDLEQEILESCRDEDGIKDRNSALKIVERWAKRVELDSAEKKMLESKEVSFTEMLPDGEKKQMKAKETKKTN